MEGLQSLDGAAYSTGWPAHVAPEALDDVAGEARELVASLVELLIYTISANRPLPRMVPDVSPIPDRGLGVAAARDLWRRVVAGSTMLSSPGMMGHINSAPHLLASLSDALVSQLNNNLIFRELSPFASRVEEVLIREFATRLGLPKDTPGTFCSGGSIANLTALFAATGGFVNPLERNDLAFFFCEAAHSSVPKAAAVLGIPKHNTTAVRADGGGHMEPGALHEELARSGKRHKIVVATLGTTLHGAVDDIPLIAGICKHHGAWLHVDAAFGGNLAFSLKNRHLLSGLSAVHSIAVAPQKWLGVPRLSALILMVRRQGFSGLDWPMPYSISDDEHRGRWGIQASRRADAVTLWVLLQVVGADRIGAWVDGSIALARNFYHLLAQDSTTAPIHKPDLALQLFRVGPAEGASERAKVLQRRLNEDGRCWLSLAQWRDETVLRAALLNRATRPEHLVAMLDVLRIHASL